MKKNPLSVDKDTLVSKALSIMNNKKITSLCVFDKKNKLKKKTLDELNVNQDAVIVDALFGIGLNKKIEGYDEILQTHELKTLEKNKYAKEIVRIAILENPNFVMSDLEILRGGISYSLDTIIEYKKETKIESKDLFFLIGSDTLKTFYTWHKPSQILKECQLIVAIRPGFRPSDIDTRILSKVQFANIPRIEISSSQIRRRWKEGKTIRYMVTQQVWEYINDNKLYN